MCMNSTEEITRNLAKMKELVATAQNEKQKQIFEDIINNLNIKLKELSPPCVFTQELSSSETASSSFCKNLDFFQGIGVVQGEIISRYKNNDNLFSIKVKGSDYKIRTRGRVLKHIKEKYHLGGKWYFLVYPHIIHFPDKEKLHKTEFSVVAIDKTNTFGLKENEFILRGIWQFIAPSKTPVISIYRNKQAFDASRFSKEALTKMTRATHVPILWKDSPAVPFRFNPKSPKDEQKSRYFCQIKAKFLPGRDVWGFQSLEAEPTLNIPKFHKPKKLKAPR